MVNFARNSLLKRVKRRIQTAIKFLAIFYLKSSLQPLFYIFSNPNVEIFLQQFVKTVKVAPAYSGP